MKTTDFEKWRDAKIAANPMVDCPECFGAGEIEETCYCCGAGKDEYGTCSGCDGVGEVPLSSLDIFSQRAHFSVSDYRAELLEDLRALSGWTGRDLCELAREAGFLLASSVSTKDLRLMDGEENQSRCAA